MKHTQLYLGIDGGGSKTEALICDNEGSLIGRGLAGPSNPYFVSIADSLSALKNAFAAACQTCDPGSIQKIMVCVPGLQNHCSLSELSQLFSIPPSSIQLSGDIENTLIAAIGDHPGVVVLAGTGSFAVGENNTREKLVLGGWGPVLGDEGGGYSIGISAIKAAIRMREGRGRNTVLLIEIINKFQISDVNELKTWFYRQENQQQIISSLVPLVVRSAENGDLVATEILSTAGVDLADLAIAVIQKLDLDKPDYFLAVTGGVGQITPWINEPFEECIRMQYRSITIKKPLATPAVGSVLLALKSSNWQITRDRIEKINQQYQRLIER